MQFRYESIPLPTNRAPPGQEPPKVKILSVNLARAEIRSIGGQQVLTAIGKRPVDGPVKLGPLGLEGDEQADLSVHGGLSKALYAYPAEHYAFWQTVRAQARQAEWQDALPPGSLGENLTLDGWDEARVWVGDRIELPDCVLAVAEPRYPCFKFEAAMGFRQAAKLMAQSGYCGTYLAVVVPGSVQAGQAARLVPGPREVNIRELFRAKMGRRRDIG